MHLKLIIIVYLILYLVLTKLLVFYKMNSTFIHVLLSKYFDDNTAEL